MRKLEIDANGIRTSKYPRCEDPDPEQVELCRRWLRLHAEPRKSVNRTVSSYGLKHFVEDWTRTLGQSFDQVDPWGRAWTGDYLYVSNGAFIAAAIEEGYRILRCGPDSPNAFLNISFGPARRREEDLSARLALTGSRTAQA